MLGTKSLIFLCVLTVSSTLAIAMEGPLARLARNAVSNDAATAERAIESLRAAGPDGLSQLLWLHGRALEQKSAPLPVVTTTDPVEPPAERIRDAIDKVAGQKDAWLSRLYWHTDFEAAKQAAASQGKPILSLRLLGRLDEELSCANSRFFRTALYANREIADHLRERYILHWHSVRPAPVITIDFGDGRRIERTITGNSLHYIFDSHGRVLDALPGLYAPQVFLANLQQWSEPQTAQALNALGDEELQSYLTMHHTAQAEALRRKWDAEIKTIERFRKEQREVDATAVAEEAAKAQMLTVGKRMAEMPMMKAVMPQLAKLEEQTNAVMWRDLAVVYAEQAKLDDSSILLMRSKHPTAHEAGRRAMTKVVVEDPILKLVRSFERSIAEDTVRNEYQLRPQLRAWIAEQRVTDLAAFTNRVYDELFLTPGDDPWLGLGSEDAYTALPGRGIVHAK